jgi:hypothetical protein
MLTDIAFIFSDLMDYDSEIYSNGALEAGTAFITPFFI